MGLVVAIIKIVAAIEIIFGSAFCVISKMQAKTNIIHLPTNPATRAPTSLCILRTKLKSVTSNTYDAKPMIALTNESNNNIVKRAIIAGKLSFMFLMFLIKIFRLNYRNYVLFKQGYLELNFDNFLMMISLSSAEKY